MSIAEDPLSGGDLLLLIVASLPLRWWNLYQFSVLATYFFLCPSSTCCNLLSMSRRHNGKNAVSCQHSNIVLWQRPEKMYMQHSSSSLHLLVDNFCSNSYCNISSNSQEAYPNCLDTAANLPEHAFAYFTTGLIPKMGTTDSRLACDTIILKQIAITLDIWYFQARLL